MAKMNPEIKQRWVAALRSGEYPQAKSALRSSDGFCCLGVLCDVIAPDGWGSVGDEEADESGLPHDHSYGVPGWAITRQAGLASPMGFEVEIAGNRQWLTVHNDNGCTFAQIADAIEAQL